MSDGPKYWVYHRLGHLRLRAGLALVYNMQQRMVNLPTETPDVASEKKSSSSAFVIFVCSLTQLGHPACIFVNLLILPIENLVVRGYLTRKCLFIDH